MTFWAVDISLVRPIQDSQILSVLPREEPMFKPIQFPVEIESLVRFVEETEQSAIIEATLSKLRGGTSSLDLLRAAALAVVRSTSLPPNHHGGPVHPICGIHGTYHVSRRLQGELAYMPIVQHLTLSNNAVHSPQMGPYIMPEMEPLESTGEIIGSYHLGDSQYFGTPVSVDAGDAMTLTINAFGQSLRAKKPDSAEHYYLWLLQRLSPGEALGVLLPASVSRNTMDDHYFLYPLFTARTLDLIGWEWASILLRPVVRFQSRNPDGMDIERPLEFSVLEDLVDKNGLDSGPLPVQSSSRETEAIGVLATEIGGATDYYDTPEMIAKALAAGLSLEGSGEALSIGASKAFLRTIYGNPMDSHLHTSANARRYLVNLEGVSQRHKVLALMSGITGPECVLGQFTIDEGVERATASIPNPTQETLLDAVTESIEALPLTDWHVSLDEVRAPREITTTIGLARLYAEKRFDPLVFFDRMAELICTDDFTELHGIKHHQAIFDEFYATREPYRWEHLVASAKSAAIVCAGRERSIYDRTKELLNV